MVELERMYCELLLRQLQSIGLFTNKQFNLLELVEQYGLHERYKNWLEVSIRFLEEKNYLTWNGETGVVKDPDPRQADIVWKEWDEQKQPWITEDNTRAQVVLVETMMRSLPDILTGKKLATDIMFPKSSFELVEGIYKNNVVVDYFNDVLSTMLINYCNLLRQQHPTVKINILEIGAGTGGTSVGIFKKLAPIQDSIGEYCYTDISKAFLQMAKSTFHKNYPYTTYHTLNIEKSTEQQGFRQGYYDVVIAANVLHATRDIKRTLINTKTLLRKNGLLLINEISQLSLFTHLTFGLTDGWWLYDDDLRIPGCPGLYPETWKKVLEEEGFRSVLFPAETSHDLGQQIIATESDGVIRLVKTPSETLQKKEPQDKELVKFSSEPSTSTTEVEVYIADMVLEQVADALKMNPGKIDKELSFAEYGVDSIIGVRLIQAINEALEIELETTDLFDYTSVKLLTDYITSNFKEEIATRVEVAEPQGKEEKPEQVIHPSPSKVRTNGYTKRSTIPTTELDSSSKDKEKAPIAIIGMSGRFPQSPTVDDLWEHLMKGENLVKKVTRWDLSQYYEENAKFCDYGAYLEDIDQFDPLFFNISGMEATYMDPQQRLFLEESWKAMENAGYVGESVKGRKCGIYVGCGGGDYTSLFMDSPPPQALWGALNSAIPARIAYLLNLKGPAVAIDTACSSSLVAIHMSCQSLWSGETEMALAGGVYINNTPQYHLLADKAGMLSQQGGCFTFDDRADGMVPGEAVGAVVLKRLDDALRDGDHIYGVIRGSGMNQDGTTNGITAPSLRSQQQLEESVYETFDINPEEIQMVEAHGTGTKLGDPIEFQGLSRSFRSFTDQKGYCSLGSIKTNIGHTQLAAGISGLIKILLSLSHKQIPPSLNFEKENANIRLEDSPFLVNTELKEWKVKPGIKRRAALSSFGATGTNAHMVIEEAPERTLEHQEKPAYLFVLSARNEEGLQKQVEQFITYCEREESGDCGNISFTLLFGRQHFKYRLACVASDLVTARQALLAWLHEDHAEDVYVSENQEQREKPAFKQLGNQCIHQCQTSDTGYKDNLSTVADLYVQGYELDYPALFTEGQYGRVPLPTYPFSPDRYWVPQPEEVTAPAKEASPVSDSSQTPVAEAMGKSAEETRLMTFAENWQQQELPDERWAPPKVWVCFLSDPSYQSLWRTGLQTRYPGTEVIFIAQGPKASRENAHSYQLPREDGAAYRQTLQRIAADWGTGFALLYLWPLEEPHFLSDYRPLFHLFQATQEAKPARFVWAGEWTSPLERSYLESWMGWERSLGFLFPQMEVAGILQKATSEALDITKWLDRLADELGTPDLESVLYDGGKRHVCRIKSTDITEGEGQIQEGGTYLITGGGGGLGRSLAANLTRSRSVNLVLTGRSPLSDSLAAEIKQWEETGSQVVYCQADVCDRAAMEAVLAEAKTRFGGIDGVIHTAGVASTAPLLAKSAADFAHVLAPKVQGVQVLDEVFASESLDFVCYFSSSSAILGDMGAGDYAIANRFLLAYADQRQAIYPGKTLVIHWPLWKEGGMGLGDEEQTHLYLASSGQRALETEEGFALFERLLGQSSTQHLVLAGQPERVYRFLGIDQPETVEPLPKQPDVLDVPAGQGRREEMKGLSVPQCVEWDLKEIASQLLQIPRHQLQVESNLADFGFDSITLATFAEQLTDHYQVEITPALFFGYPTLGKLTDYYMTEHKEAMADFYREGTTREKPSLHLSTEDQPAPKESSQPVRSEKLEERKSPSAPQVPAAPTQPDTEPIAVIGMSGRFPGARNIAQLWEHLVQGEEQVQPTTRWSEEGEPWHLGMVPGVREFDPTFFGISPREAQNMDPRQRLLLQEAWKALEDAGYGEKQLARQQIGMFVGVENGDYQYLSGFDGPITSNHDAILAARLSYVLNLSGPNMAINTACSSGLVGLHQACQSLRMGDCDTAIAAGVNLVLLPQTLEAIDQAGMLSPDGRCYAFDERANGMVPGEAVAAVVLKRLSQAQADQDPIYAVIRGSGMNYDGKTNGITAPNGVVQSQLYRSVYDRYGIDPETLSYIVTHGTGTRLGDPVEVNGLRDAFQSYTKKEGFCAITSTKTNFGHTFAASGLVSLISMVQALRHETIPASLHCEQENKYIQWENSPFYVNKTNQEWKDSPGKPRRGAVSAFGMSGTNVHLVVESYSKEERDEKGTSLPYYLLALSAKTEEALAEKVTDLIAYLEDPEGQKADLLQVSYTLLHGRQHFRHRWAMIVHQKEDALYALKRAINKENTPNLFHGVVPSMFTSQTALMKYITSLLEQNKDARKDPQQYQENLMALATMYCQGYEIDSEALFFGTNAKSLHMPTYPFARNNYWVESKEPDMRYSIRETIDSPSPNEDPTTKSLRNEPKKDHGEASKQYALQHLSTPEIDTWSSVPIAKPESIQLTGVKDKSRGNEHSETSDIEEIEKSIAMLLKEVLDLDQENVDRDMPFIEMGMDSIVGVEWIQAVNNQYQTSFTANSIYEFPNIRKFATALAQSSSGFAEDAIDGENESKIDSTLPIEPIDKPNDSPTLNNTEEVISYLVESLAESLSMDKKEIKLDSELVELGLDSIIGVEWIQAINERYGLTLTANSIYEYPYLREFADFILGQLSMENELDNSSPLHLQQLVKSVQAGEIDIEQADQLLQRGDIKK